jgi:hypothetical protein
LVSGFPAENSCRWAELPFFTNSDLPGVEADLIHRRHAIVLCVATLRRKIFDNIKQPESLYPRIQA